MAAPHHAPAVEHDSTVMKVIEASAPTGPQGEKYLAAGRSLGMRLFRNLPVGAGDLVHAREYETCGYCIEGRAKLILGSGGGAGGAAGGSGGGGGQEIVILPGVSYVVPKGMPHRWHIDETFSAVEACAPVPFIHDRDKPAKSGLAAPEGVQPGVRGVVSGGLGPGKGSIAGGVGGADFGQTSM